MILFVNDFYVENKEAISSQMALLTRSVDGVIISATRFLGQKPLRLKNLKSGKYIFPPILYQFFLPFFILFSRQIHLFTEEASLYKRVLVNFLKKPIYVSIYRRPSEELIEDLKKYKNLRKVFVEVDLHRDILIKNGFDKEVVSISPTPSLFREQASRKNFNNENISLLFASWNTEEGDYIKDRGLLYLAKLLSKNKEFKLQICLRDNNTDNFKDLLKKEGLMERVDFIYPNDYKELASCFSKADFVVFLPQRRVTKDNPNSIIDGFMFGKPTIVSDKIDICRLVTKKGLGIVLNDDHSRKITINKNDYEAMRSRVLRYRKNHLESVYVDSIINYYN